MEKQVDLEKYKPLGSYFVAKTVDDPITASGLILENVDQEKLKPFFEGEVVSVGPDVKDLKVGDHFLISWHYGTTYWKEKETKGEVSFLKAYCMFKEENILFKAK